MRALYPAVQAYVDFTGGEGDADIDEDERFSNEYIQARINRMKETKKHAESGKKLSKKLICDWLQSDWLDMCKQRFGRNPAVQRDIHFRDGRVSPPPAQLRDAESESDSDIPQEVAAPAVAKKAVIPREKGVPEPAHAPKKSSLPAADSLMKSFESISRFVDTQTSSMDMQRKKAAYDAAVAILNNPTSPEHVKERAKEAIARYTEYVFDLI
ncbi:uncharacterized protein B0H18DRAFT_1019059 [Fomitopsis serialis]|uniref:uncharacterized protein n=1 Tax=Fomitopsis serialis TaxID=139415 RepID=UPI002008D3AF|nr:uncharacterized protein B0H18DRAFT_1019059 [Neoantrodia serialis]KAH9922086.1 hypothetical protein B0H18DRAFT_1019059 [Neoantrodia serialis]